MPVYHYQARDRVGNRVEGMVEALSEEAVANLLTEKRLNVVAITRKSVAQAKGADLWHFFSRVKSKDQVFFFRQLSVMIDANLPIVKSLKILTKQTSSPRLKIVVAGLADAVEGGARLSDAMSDFADVFGNFYINMVRSGETSGRLAEVMNYLADQEEKDYDLRSKIKGAMIYPAFILSGLFVVGIVVMIFVVPQITGMLKDTGVALPWTTRLLIGTANLLKNFWWALVLLAVAAVVGFSYGISTKGGRLVFDSFQLKVPVFGKIFRNIYLVRVTQSLGTLMQGGVPIGSALAFVKEVVGNKVFEQILEQTIKDVGEGNAISDAWTPHFHEIPVAVSQMIGVGEETGKLEVVLAKVTSFYSREIDNSVRNLSVLVEPIIMIVLGIAVGVFVSAVILPMWQLSAAM